MKTTSRIWLMSLLIGTLPLSAQSAHAGKETGGGDLCEKRISAISADIAQWIRSGGPRNLSLPTGESAESYSEKMLAAISTAEVRCVSPGSDGFPVQVGTFAKTCKFERLGARALITCDYDRFRATHESDQYVLIHHELAGQANIEPPTDEKSHYEISDQISGFLEDQVVKKLSVSPSRKTGAVRPSGLTNELIDRLANQIMGLPIAGGTDVDYPYPYGVRYYVDRYDRARDLVEGRPGDKKADYVCFLGTPADEIFSRLVDGFTERYPAQCISLNDAHPSYASTRGEIVIDGDGERFDFRRVLGPKGNFGNLRLKGCVGTDLSHMFCSFRVSVPLRRLPENHAPCDTLAGVIDCGHHIRPGEGTGG